MQDTIFNKLIDFRHGTQEEYNSLVETVGGIKDEDLYYITQDVELSEQTLTLSKLYVGNNILGDTYLSQFTSTPSKRVTNPIGLIPYGMTLGELLSTTGGSISKVVDMMLFTEQAHTIDEYAIIAGFIPKVDVSDNWTDSSVLSNWISDYATLYFKPEYYETFYDTVDPISSLFTVVLNPSKSIEEFDRDTGTYSGRMFVAIPYDTSRTQKDITTIVDKIFMNVYTGSGLRDNFTTQVMGLMFNDQTYMYKVYLFSETQSVISRLNMEYSIEIR